jgi:hypothetical protein
MASDVLTYRSERASGVHFSAARAAYWPVMFREPRLHKTEEDTTLRLP